VSFADLRDPARLLALLQAALAAGLHGACKHHEAYSDHRIAVVRAPGVALRPGQALDKPLCTRLCGATEVELTCQVATIDMAPNPGARVRCGPGTHVLLSPELHELVQLGEETVLAPEQCRSVCAAVSPAVSSCVVEPVPHRQALRPGLPISKKEPFVMCSTHYPAHTEVDIVGPLPSGRVASEAVAFRGRARSDAEYFSRAAYYEAASVAAFRRLSGALLALGAPAHMAARARTFARDEARHCRAWLGLLEAAHGVEARRARVRSWPGPIERQSSYSAFDLALENLLEGCVGESYGAWLALHQAGHGASRELRRVARGIAGDEAAHAALAFEIHAWLWPRLDGAQQSALECAAARAIDDLIRPLPLDPCVAAHVGTPAPAAHAFLLAPLQALLRRTCD
jgi:hypothetical protein